MDTVGLRELRLQASELLRRVEAGEELTITVAGRPAARLVRAAPRSWRSYRDVEGLFRGRDDPMWDADLALIDQQGHDGWTAE
jgi:prevent-host-death family protein